MAVNLPLARRLSDLTLPQMFCLLTKDLRKDWTCDAPFVAHRSPGRRTPLTRAVAFGGAILRQWRLGQLHGLSDACSAYSPRHRSADEAR